MKNKYSRKELEQALADFKDFIRMTKESPKGVPIRLKIVRDLLIKELEK